MTAKKILIVEDMPDWREQLASTLKRDGYTVASVASYGEALGELRRDDYHAVIVDLRLSETDVNNRDGMILLEDLAKLRLPAIVLTGYGTAELARKAFQDFDVVDFLEKKDLNLKKFRQIVKESVRQKEKKKKELADLRDKFLNGEIIKLQGDRVKNILSKKPENYAQ